MVLGQLLGTQPLRTGRTTTEQDRVSGHLLSGAGTTERGDEWTPEDWSTLKSGPLVTSGTQGNGAGAGTLRYLQVSTRRLRTPVPHQSRTDPSRRERAGSEKESKLSLRL